MTPEAEKILHPMTAQEALIRSNEASKIAGEIYGRLQSELLEPLVKFCVKAIDHERTKDEPR